ncbi:acyltransferase [Paenibacillus sp. CC-CFT747]|nr:acyltransferase [Paenibacillus sp. CC-CFT747]
MIIKIINTLQNEIRSRGLYITIIMLLTQCVGLFRGYIYKIMYFRNISSTYLTLQANSKIEIFDKESKVTFGKNVFIRKNASIRMDHGGQLILGDKVFINDNCNINCVNKIMIGNNSKIAPNVSINDHDHNYKDYNGEHLIKGNIIIGENVWVGSNVVILRDTSIGDNTVIAAGSVVKGDVPANSIFYNKREKTITPYGMAPSNIMQMERYK